MLGRNVGCKIWTKMRRVKNFILLFWLFLENFVLWDVEITPLARHFYMQSLKNLTMEVARARLSRKGFHDFHQSKTLPSHLGNTPSIVNRRLLRQSHAHSKSLSSESIWVVILSVHRAKVYLTIGIGVVRPLGKAYFWQISLAVYYCLSWVRKISAPKFAARTRCLEDRVSKLLVITCKERFLARTCS